MPKKSKRLKKHKSHKDKKHKKHKKYSESESSSSSSDNDSLDDYEWVEKKSDSRTSRKHDDWMMDTSFVPTYSIEDKRSNKKTVEKEESFLDKPGQSDRELNPYWKNGGTGLPEASIDRKNSDYDKYHRTKPGRSFMKPDDDAERSYDSYSRSRTQSTKSRWRKQPTGDEHQSQERSRREDRGRDEKEDRIHESDRRKKEEPAVRPEPPKTSALLSDQEMNALASKILKAEILGNKDLVQQLTEKLENSRRARLEKTEASRVVVLGMGDFDSRKTIDERFVEEEPQPSGEKSRKEIEKMRREKEKEKQQAISKHMRTEKVLENCTWCLTNNKLQKHLIVSKGSTCYLSVPYFRSLTEGHCLIVPTYHSTCITLLDEDVWDEVMDYCKKLVRMFRDEDQDVVFFETAVNLKYHPHMVLHCVPIPYESGNLAPIYFKKAIQECEKEWAINKKLVEYKKMDIRKSVPKELPYFMVNFGMDSGFAHVIEEEQYFPKNFAQEIIGGMLDLDHLVWRKQHADDFETQCKKVNKFKELWNKIES